MIGRQEWSDVILMTIIATYLSTFAVDDSFDAIQIKRDWEVSRGAFVFADKCKARIFFFSLTTCDRTSFIVTKFEEQQILLIQQRFFG